MQMHIIIIFESKLVVTTQENDSTCIIYSFYIKIIIRSILSSNFDLSNYYTQIAELSSACERKKNSMKVLSQQSMKAARSQALTCGFAACKRWRAHSQKVGHL